MYVVDTRPRVSIKLKYIIPQWNIGFNSNLSTTFLIFFHSLDLKMGNIFF